MGFRLPAQRIQENRLRAWGNCVDRDVFSLCMTFMRHHQTERAPAGKMSDRKQSNPRSDIGQRLETSVDEARLRQQVIGMKLRQLFDGVVQEPVPDALLGILRTADGPDGPKS